MSTASPKPSLTESPWYWVYLFCTAGLIALVIMGPRFSARQSQIERKYQARQRAAHQVAGEQPRTPMSSEGNTFITLWPLYLILGSVLIVSVTMLMVRRRNLNLRLSNPTERQVE